MSGAEAITLVQLIDACISITQAIINISLAVKDAQGLPPTLRDLYEKLPAIRDLLATARENCDEGSVTEENSKNAKPILEQCERALKELADIFRKACPAEGDDRTKRIWKGARIVFLGRDNRVQNLLDCVQNNLKLLEQKEIFRIGDKLDELQQFTEALSQDDDGMITHTGSGNVLANRGGTHTNYLMSGSGRQIINPGVYHEGPSSTSAPASTQQGQNPAS